MRASDTHSLTILSELTTLPWITEGAALTKCCDHDVEGYCALEQHKRVVYSIGHVGKCLATQLAAGHSLASECQQLILAAAPQVLPALPHHPATPRPPFLPGSFPALPIIDLLPRSETEYKIQTLNSSNSPLAQDSRALINAKSAQKMLAAKMRETQMRIRAAALNSQALAHAKLIDKEVRMSSKTISYDGQGPHA